MSDPQRFDGGRNWRRYLRFRLSSLLIVVTVFAVVLGLFGVRWYRSLQEKWTIDELRNAGGVVVTREDGAAVRVWLGGAELDDARLAELAPKLLRLPDLREVDVVDSPVTDEGLKHLEILRQIRLLYIHETRASEAGLEGLARALPDVELRREAPDPIATKLVARVIYPSAVVASACSPDGLWLVTGSGDGLLRWWHRDEAAPTDTVQAHRNWLFTLAFSPDGRILASGGGDNRIKFWDVATRRLAFELAGHLDDVHSLAFDPSGRTLYSAGDDRVVRVWDLGSRQQVDVLVGHRRAIPSLALSADGRTLATASRDGTIQLWDIASRPRRLMHILEGHNSDVAAVAFSSDGATLASGGNDHMVRVWDAASGEQRLALAGHADWVFCVAFSPDGRRLVSGAGDGTVRLWDWEAGTNIAVLNGQKNISSIRFNPTGDTMFAIAADGTVFVRSAASGDVQRVLRTRFGDRELAMVRP